MAKKPFSIDDAFDENLDDVVVRVYGSTTVDKPTFNGRNHSGVKPVSTDGMTRKKPFLSYRFFFSFRKLSYYMHCSTFFRCILQPVKWILYINFFVYKGPDSRAGIATSSTPSHGTHSHPVLLSIRTGIMQDDVCCSFFHRVVDIQSILTFFCCFLFFKTASKDSDSLIHESYQYSPSYFDPERIWLKHPRVKENWKVVATAFALVIVGLGTILS